MKLLDFINKVKQNGKWGVHDFTAELIDILEATRDIPSNDDWIELPKKIINSLELNEKKRKKFLSIKKNKIDNCILLIYLIISIFPFLVACNQFKK